MGGRRRRRQGRTVGIRTGTSEGEGGRRNSRAGRGGGSRRRRLATYVSERVNKRHHGGPRRVREWERNVGDAGVGAGGGRRRQSCRGVATGLSSGRLAVARHAGPAALATAGNHPGMGMRGVLSEVVACSAGSERVSRHPSATCNRCNQRRRTCLNGKVARGAPAPALCSQARPRPGPGPPTRRRLINW